MTALAHPYPHAERDGFEAAVLPLRPVLYGRALHLCRNPAQAEDLVQDTVIRAWRFWPSFRQGTNCAAWLKTILVRSFLTRCREQGRERRLVEAVRLVQAVDRDAVSATAHVPADATDATFGDEVVAALDTLPTVYRQVLQLIDVEGLEYQSAAERIGCPVGTVMSRLHRARRAMRKALQPYAAEHGYCDRAGL